MKLHKISRSLCAPATALGACIVLVAACSFEQAWAGIQISGLDERQQRNVRAYLSLVAAECDSSRRRIERFYADSRQEIRTALRTLGYYDPVISRSLNWDDECWQANFYITPGEPVRYRTVNIRIAPLASADDAFRARHTIAAPAPDDILDHGLYESFKSSLLRASTFAGFFDAQFTASEVVVDRDARAADMNMEFDSGTKYRFGEVNFTEDILRPGLLARYSDIRPGDPYSAELLLRCR
jgi:translocation and assembly module TamA